MFSLPSLSILGFLFLGCNNNSDAVSPLISNDFPNQAPFPNAQTTLGAGQPLELDLDTPLEQTTSIETIKERVKYFSLRTSERVWEHIPWVTDFETAQAMSQETQRPIFMFSMWGELDGRC